MHFVREQPSLRNTGTWSEKPVQVWSFILISLERSLGLCIAIPHSEVIWKFSRCEMWIAVRRLQVQDTLPVLSSRHPYELGTIRSVLSQSKSLPGYLAHPTLDSYRGHSRMRTVSRNHAYEGTYHLETYRCTAVVVDLVPLQRVQEKVEKRVFVFMAP